MRRAILTLAVIAPLFLVLYFKINPLLAIGVLFLSHMLILFPTLVANCQWWGPVITRFATPRREVWLTIDDGPDAIHTPRLLEILQRFEAKATFFVIGQRSTRFSAEVESIRAAGHEVANHTYSHPSRTFWCLPPSRIASEIDRCGISARSFRAPGGMKNFFVHPVLARRNLQLVGWTVRGLDTVSRDPAVVAARIMRRVNPGAIVVLHEGHRTATNPDFHPRCLELILLALTKANYRCVLPMPEQLRLRAGGK